MYFEIGAELQAVVIDTYLRGGREEELTKRREPNFILRGEEEADREDTAQGEDEVQ